MAATEGDLSNDVRRRVILEKRIVVGSDGAWVSREGSSIKISFDAAGRFSREPLHFYTEDILKLADFVKETEQPA